MNKLYSRAVTAIVAIVSIMIISAGTFTIWLGQTPQMASGQPSMFTRILQDDPAGNAAGWDPDGSKRTFTIVDPEFSASDNTVVINTVQNNFVVCSVDYRIDRIFEVNCIETTSGTFPSDNITALPDTILEGGPADGAILYYTVVHAPLIPLRGSVSPDVLAQAQNQTAARGLEESPTPDAMAGPIDPGQVPEPIDPGDIP
jgi:hypothetical protein